MSSTELQSTWRWSTTTSVNLEFTCNECETYPCADCFPSECCSQKGSTILKLLANKDEALRVRWNALLVLNLHLDIVNCVRWLHDKSNGFTHESFDEDLHTTMEDKENWAWVQLNPNQTHQGGLSEYYNQNVCDRDLHTTTKDEELWRTVSMSLVKSWPNAPRWTFWIL